MDKKLSLSEVLKEELNETNLVLPEVRETNNNKQRTYQGNSAVQRMWKCREVKERKVIKARRRSVNEVGVATCSDSFVTRITFNDKISQHTQQKIDKFIFKLQCLRRAVTPDLH